LLCISRPPASEVEEGSRHFVLWKEVGRLSQAGIDLLWAFSFCAELDAGSEKNVANYFIPEKIHQARFPRLLFKRAIRILWPGAAVEFDLDFCQWNKQVAKAGHLFLCL